MITFILATIAIMIIAGKLHTTIIYATLFLCGAIAIPLMPALQLTALCLSAWILTESVVFLSNKLHAGGFKVLWQVGQFRVAVMA